MKTLKKLLSICLVLITPAVFGQKRTKTDLNDNWKIIGGIYNVFDEEVVISRLPEGPRVGRGRNFYAGFELEF